MGENLRLRVVTPNGPVLDEEAIAVTACSELGEFCVLPEHRPILSALSVGRLVVEHPEGRAGFESEPLVEEPSCAWLRHGRARSAT